MKEMQQKMIDQERQQFDVGRNPAGAMERFTEPMLQELYEKVEGEH